MSKQQNIKMMTPTVEIRWAYLTTPDTAFDKDGVYQFDMVLDKTNEQHLEFLKQLKAHTPNGAKNQPYKKSTEEGEENLFIVRCKQKARVGSFTFKPRLFDSSGAPITTDISIGNGTKVNAQVEFRPYDMNGGGLRLNPVAIQIVDLVAYESEETSEESNPFGAVEGTFKADNFQNAVEEPEVQEDLEDDIDF